MGQKRNINLFELPSFKLSLNTLLCKMGIIMYLIMYPIMYLIIMYLTLRIKGDYIYISFTNFKVLYYILGKARSFNGNETLNSLLS